MNTAEKRTPRPHPKGRQTDPAMVSSVRRTVAHLPLERAYLIEHLHALQDRFGHLSRDHLAALAKLLDLAQAEVFETVSFYAHFHIAEDPQPKRMRTCRGIVCRMHGAKVGNAPCLGRCDLTPAWLDGFADDGDFVVPEGTFGTLEPSPDLAEIIERSGLRGLGGAGFPAAHKWRFVMEAEGDKVLIVNADEGEPGTFKDRYLLETNPHLVLTGAVLAARAIGARDLYVYLRDEYPHLRHMLEGLLADLQPQLPDIRLHLRRGAGAYICGEETALIESLEGKPGKPRNRPPYPATVGLFGRPTLTHNVETLYWIAQIADNGGRWYQDAGRPRFYSVSGRVAKPGVIQAPSTTTTVAELISLAGGMKGGHEFTAFLPGGASGGIFPAVHAERAMDFGSFESLGGFVGSGALIVLSGSDDLWDVARQLGLFFADESCGQCTPCRVGTEKMLRLIDDPAANAALIRELAAAMQEASICGLGQAAPNPVLSLLNHFPGVLPKMLKEGGT